jgi:hypothetical protein
METNEAMGRIMKPTMAVDKSENFESMQELEGSPG